MSEYSNIIDEAFGADQRSQARMSAYGAIDSDPEQAARAIELTKGTKVPPSVALGDLENFETQHKGALAGSLIEGSPYLQQYINSNPMAVHVSNDDYGQLDAISGALHKLRLHGAATATSVLGKAAQGFWEGLETDRRLGEGVLSKEKQEDLQFKENYPLLYNEVKGLTQAGAEIYDVFARPLVGALKGLKAGTEEFGIQMGMDPSTAKRFGRDIAGMAEYQLQQTPGKGVGVPKLGEALAVAEPYLRSGLEPPVGLHPLIDEAKKKQSEMDLANLDEVTKKVQKSTTRERSPELAKAFIEQHVGQAKIGISADAVAELYKEKVPHAEDGLLGWVEDLPQQLEIALATGGDIEVPLADWLARVEPEIAKELHDNIRVRKGGLTKEESKIVSQQYSVAEESKTTFEIEQEAFREKNNLPPATQEEMAGLIEGRIRQIELDRRQSKVEGEPYPPNAELFSLRKRLREIQNDQAVEAVRKEAGLKSLFQLEFGDVSYPALIKDDLGLAKGRKIEVGDIIAYTKDVWNENEQKIIAEVSKVLDRIVPDVESHAVARQSMLGSFAKLQGTYTQFSDRMPLILWSLNAEAPLGTARHEALHHLRNYGFFKEGEWDTLVAAAMDGDWIKKHQIEERYPEANRELKFEEAIADEFAEWYKNPDAASPKTIFEKLKQLFEDIKAAIGRALGHEPTFQELFDMAERGKLAKRGAGEPLFPESFRQQFQKDQPELPGVTRQEDLALFENARAVGMTADQYKRYQALIEKQQAEDVAYSKAKAEKLERAKQTKEWKEEENVIRGEVEADLLQRPDISLSEYFRTGKLYNEETGSRPRLDTKQLTPEQRKIFPDKWTRRDGMAPEDAAQLFGYRSVDDMVQSIAKLEADIEATGYARTGDYINRLIREETARRMADKFGDLDENIIREAQEHVVSPTQMDLLHEETVALGMRSGSEMPFAKADLRKWAETRFDEARASDVSLERFLKEAGKAGREAELALLKDDATEAFKQKQRQYLAMLLAEQAKKFEKEKDRFDRTLQRYTQRVVKGVDSDFQTWIQDILTKAGQPGRRSANELREGIARQPYDNLRSFHDATKGDGWELFVDESLLSGEEKALEQMSVAEWRAFRDSIKSLDWVGRKVKKILIAGAEEDFDAVRQDILDNVRQLPPRDKNKAYKWRYALDAILTKKEEIIKDLDLRQEFGPMFRAIIPAIADSNHTEFSMMEKLTKDLKAIKGDFGGKWQKSLHDTIPNDFMIDPYDGAHYDLSREHMINMMLQFGNESNKKKAVGGWFGKDRAAWGEARLQQLFDQHATKQDWEYVQKIWDLWEGWRPLADDLYYQLSGIPPKWIEPTPITNQHGTFSGGYMPIIWDRLRSKLNQYEERPTEMGKGRFGQNYIRSTPGNAYTKTRTGAIDYVEFLNPTDQIAGRMHQVIHDISFRQTVMEVGKIVDDPAIRKAIEKHYGIEYAEQLKPWLNHMANQYSYEEASLSAVNTWMRRARTAMLIHTLGLNLGVILSPATGKVLPTAALRYGLPFTEKRALNSEMILEKSRELAHSFRNIDRDYREALDATIKGNKLDEFQAKAVEFAFTPTVKVDQYFREVTFYEEYNRRIAEGRPEGEAIALADSTVRERHGTGADANLPRIMQGSEALKIFTLFYGWFNTSYNWQRQIPGQLKRGEYANAAQTALWAVVLPSILFGPIFTDRKEGESIFSTWAKSGFLQVAGTIPGVREIANKFIEGHSARSPWTALIDSGYSAYNDLRKKMEGKKTEKATRHAINVIGLGTGLPLGQVGKTSQFLTDVETRASGKQPRNIWEWIRGIVWGEARLKKERH